MKLSKGNHALKKSTENENMSFSRSKNNQKMISWMQTLSQKMTNWKNFNLKFNAFFLQSKICCVVKPLNQNLTRCEHLVSKSDALENFISNLASF